MAISSSITIRNRLEIRPDNTIQVPGCEPISSLSSNTLAANMDCVGTVIDLDVALEKLPGSTVVMIYNGGGALATIRRFFVLPDGPPPSPAVCNSLDANGNTTCRTDWYKIMKENARSITDVETTEPTIDSICNFFSLRNRSEIL